MIRKTIFEIIHLFLISKAMKRRVDYLSFYREFWRVKRRKDYLAGGFFTGLAFLCLGIAIEDKDKMKRSIKTNLLTCGILCLIGFFGTVFINENIWYVAPMGYGIKTMNVCIQTLKFSDIK